MENRRDFGGVRGLVVKKMNNHCWMITVCAWTA